MIATRAFAAAIAAVLLLGLVPLTPSPTTQAFFPPVHQKMFRDAVGDQFSAEARGWVELGLAGPDALTGQTHPEWHFDNAKDRDEVCQRWEEGPSILLAEVVDHVFEALREKPPGERATFDRLGTYRELALTRYGYYLHAIHDFYAHSNWIELHVEKGQTPGMAPIAAGCVADALPADLTTGYFDIAYVLNDFCPPEGPPLGFRFCHSDLAKDSPTEHHGGETLPGSSTTYHQEAVRLATAATGETFQVLHDRVVAMASDAFPDRDAECLFTWLVKGGDPACPRGASGLYRTETAQPGTAYALGLWDQQTAQLAVVQAFRVEIRLDPTTHQITGGAFFSDVVLQAALDREQGEWYRVTFEAARTSKLSGVGPRQQAADLVDGIVGFEGRMTAYRAPPENPQQPSLAQDQLLEFAFALDDAGRLVLCSWASMDVQEQHRECLANPIAILQPATETPA